MLVKWFSGYTCFHLDCAFHPPKFHLQNSDKVGRELTPQCYTLIFTCEPGNVSVCVHVCMRVLYTHTQITMMT